MKKLPLLFPGLAVMLVLSMSASAQDDPWIYFGGGYTATAGNTSTDYGAGLYSGTLSATKPSSPTGLGTYQFVCDDFDDHIQSGEYWDTNQTTIYNLSGVQFNTPFNDTSITSQLQAYAEALWLAQDLLFGATNGDSTSHPSAASDAGAVSWAIWTIMDNPGTMTQGSGKVSDVTALMTAANSWWSGCTGTNQAACEHTVADIYIYTPINNPSDWINPVYENGKAVAPQEFFGATPEPLSMALMGTFLTLAGLGLGKKKLFS
jgi:hypothetical protein